MQYDSPWTGRKERPKERLHSREASFFTYKGDKFFFRTHCRTFFCSFVIFFHFSFAGQGLVPEPPHEVEAPGVQGEEGAGEAGGEGGKRRRRQQQEHAAQAAAPDAVRDQPLRLRSAQLGEHAKST